MERVAVSAHDATVSRRNAGVAAGGLLDSTAVLIASAFNKHVHRLCTLSMRLGTSAFVDVNAIYYAAYDVLLALMALLCSRRVGYWRVANVLCSRMFAEAASEQRR